MTVLRYLLWTGAVAASLGILWLIQYPLRKRGNKILQWIVFIIKILLGAFAAYATMVIEAAFTYRLGFVLAALHVALLGDAVGDLLILLVSFRKKRSVKTRTIVCTICTALYFLYGTLNMQIVTANRLTVTSEKLNQNYTFAFVSDMHVGSSQSLRTTEKTIQKIASESPDFIVLGGDIVDEYTTKEEMEQVFTWFGNLNMPVYFIYGNHDRQPSAAFTGGQHFTQQELETAILDNNIQILRDEWISFDNDLIILGREDVSIAERLPIDSLKPRPEEPFVLMVDHSPYQYDDITASKADFQISGHSHAGQIFPLQWIYEMAGYTAYGFYHHGDTEVYVSAGASGWCIPFRTEAACHYEIVSLVGA